MIIEPRPNGLLVVAHRSQELMRIQSAHHDDFDSCKYIAPEQSTIGMKPENQYKGD